jgi:hypothetical protein
MKLLTRYWFTFTSASKPSPFNIGCGVTAFSYADALELLRERLTPEDLARVAGHVKNIDVSILDPGSSIALSKYVITASDSGTVKRPRSVRPRKNARYASTFGKRLRFRGAAANDERVGNMIANLVLDLKDVVLSPD